MASKLINAAVLAAITAGITLASMGLVPGIGTYAYAFFQGLTLKSTLIYLGTSAMLIAPIVIEPIRQFLASGLNILISRFSWQARTVNGQNPVFEEFTNKSPLAQIKHIRIKRTQDRNYEITVNPANIPMHNILRQRLVNNGFANLLKRSLGHEIILKTANQSVISNFFYHISKETPEVGGLIRKFRTNLAADFGLDTNSLLTQSLMPSWVIQQKLKPSQNQDNANIRWLTLTSTNDYHDVLKIKIASNLDVKIVYGAYLSDRVKQMLNNAGIPYIHHQNHVLITNISRAQLTLINNFLFEYDERSTDKINDFFHNHMRMIAPLHNVVVPALNLDSVEEELNQEEEVQNREQDDSQDIDSAKLEKIKLSNQQRLEKINVQREQKGLPEIDPPDKFLCTIMWTLMDQAVYAPKTPQRFDLPNIIAELDRRGENPCNRQPLYRNELKHDKKLQKEINDYLNDLENNLKPEVVPKAEPAPIIPAAKRFKQTTRKNPEVNQAEGVATPSHAKRQRRR